MKQFISNKLPKDKLLHFFAGFFLYIGFSIFFTPLLSLLFTTVLAVLNEVIDEHKKKGAFDWIDIIFTIIPALILISLLC